jgi:hypothetical protein
MPGRRRNLEIKVPRFLAAPTAALAALVLLSCGGHGADAPTEKARGAGGAEPAAVRLAHTAAGPNAKASSGVISAEGEIAIKGVKRFEEPFSNMVSGRFQMRKGAALPDYELELGVRNYGVTLTSVNGKSYVSVGTTAYELPPAVRQRLIRTSRRGRNGLTRTLEQFGIAPWRWETEQRVAGTETIDGVATTHLATSFNAGRILRDVNTLLGLMRSLGLTRATGLPPTITAKARRVFVKGVTTKTGGSWIGVADTVLRQAGFTMRFATARADRSALGGITGGSVVAKLDVTDVGKPQKIDPPANVGSFADFRLAIAALDEAQEAGG